MSRKNKLLDKLCKNPRPKDFRWEDIVTLMQQAGFEVECDGGSHHMFEHRESGFRLSMSKTHPSGILKPYQIKAAIEALERVGAIPGEK